MFQHSAGSLEAAKSKTVGPQSCRYRRHLGRKLVCHISQLGLSLSSGLVSQRRYCVQEWIVTPNFRVSGRLANTQAPLRAEPAALLAEFASIHPPRFRA